jgi:hypothetical protein
MPGEWERKIIKAGYNKLAERCHPDHGGKAEDMIALNAARDNLLSWLSTIAAADGPNPVIPSPEIFPRIPHSQPVTPPWPQAQRPAWLTPEVEAQLREVFSKLRRTDPVIDQSVGFVAHVMDFFTKSPKKKRGAYRRR